MLRVGLHIGKERLDGARAFFRNDGRVLAVEHDVVLGQLGLALVILHRVATGFLGGFDHQANAALQRQLRLLHGLHRIQQGGDRTLVVNRAAPIELVTHARDLERIDLLAIDHPLRRHHGHHIGVRENAKLLAAGTGQGHLKNAVVDIAEVEAKILAHLLDHLAKLDDRRVLMRRNLGISHGGQRHHFFDAGQHRRLLTQPRVQPQKTRDVGELFTLQWLASGVVLHRTRNARLLLGRQLQKLRKATRYLCGLHGDGVERRLLQRLGKARGRRASKSERDGKRDGAASDLWLHCGKSPNGKVARIAAHSPVRGRVCVRTPTKNLISPTETQSPNYRSRTPSQRRLVERPSSYPRSLYPSSSSPLRQSLECRSFRSPSASAVRGHQAS